jgi:hypothetical protein
MAIKTSLHLLPKLVHLSINLHWKILLEFLIDLPGTLKLDTLHVKLRYNKKKLLCEDHARWIQLVDAVVAIDKRKEPRPIKARRVYVYGKKKKVVKLDREMKEELAELRWVKGEPPFANFDGKFMGTLQR